MRRPRTLTTVVTVALTAVISTLATLAVAVNGPVTGTGTDITRVKTISQGAWVGTSSTSPVDVPDASRSINVTGSALLVARFQADAFCSGSGGAKCFVRIVVDNGTTETEIFPGPSVFLTANSFPTEQTRSIERSVTVGAGTYTIQVQAFVEDGDDGIELLRYHLTLERIV